MSIILNPEDHRSSALQFLDYYAIKQKSPGQLFLEEILEKYTNLPYENISKIIKLNQDFRSENRIRLPDQVINEHEQFKFGGTCFSLTFYLESILKTLGFNCYPIMADMRNQPNIHCALVVIMEMKKYLIDPGYLLTRPMEIHPDAPRLYRTEHTGVELRFDQSDERYHLYTFDREQKKWRYRFWERPTPPADFLRFWQESFYKGTMHGIVMTKINPDGMIYMHNNYLKITSIEGQQKKRLKEDYLFTVEDIFGFDSELVEKAQEAMQRNMALERELGIYKKKDKNAAD